MAAPTTTAAAAPKPTTRVPSIAQDSQYYLDLSQLDPSLTTYVNEQSDLALRALLTDGTAFCSIFQAGGGIDNAMVSLAAGARSVEAKTHLPFSVTTFNAIDSAALLALCPTAQRLLPSADQNKLQQLAAALGHP